MRTLISFDYAIKYLLKDKDALIISVTGLTQDELNDIKNK